MNRYEKIIRPSEIKRWSPENASELGSKIALWRGDITKLQIDAIVNAANNSLLGGGGVDGAIHAAAGPDLLKECTTLNGCETGEAKITKGYKLPSKHVIHTVGPIGEKSKFLKSCYKESLNLLRKNNLRSIAFPCISTGIYGYPNEAAAKVVFRTTRDWLQSNSEYVDLIVFCLFMPVDVEIYNKLAKKYFPKKSNEKVMQKNDEVLSETTENGNEPKDSKITIQSKKAKSHADASSTGKKNGGKKNTENRDEINKPARSSPAVLKEDIGGTVKE